MSLANGIPSRSGSEESTEDPRIKEEHRMPEDSALASAGLDLYYQVASGKIIQRALSSDYLSENCTRELPLSVPAKSGTPLAALEWGADVSLQFLLLVY